MSRKSKDIIRINSHADLNKLFKRDTEAVMSRASLLKNSLGLNGDYSTQPFSRESVMRFMIDGCKDIDAECGYPPFLTPDHYRFMYDRIGPATRVVHCEPEESWAVDPEVYEDESPKTKTKFEEAWDAVLEKHNLWHVLQHADILSGIGQFGVIFLGIDDGRDLSEPVDGIDDDGYYDGGNEHELLFIRPLSEEVVFVKSRNDDLTSPRYGQAEMYTVLFREYPNWGAHAGEILSRDVHWTRMVHLADNKKQSILFGTPRLQNVSDRMIDLRKIASSNGEGYWRSAFPGLAFEVDNDINSQNIDFDKESMKESMRRYVEGLDRWFAVQGVKAKTLPPAMVGPKESVETQLKLIAISKNIPYRILFGSEEAKLAADQDSRKWNKRLAGRQAKYVTPCIIRPVIDRLIAFGCLPKPAQYKVDWPDLNAPTDQDKAMTALTETQALAAYVGGNCAAACDLTDFYVTFLRKTKQEAEQLVKNAQKFNSTDFIDETTGGKAKGQDDQMQHEQQLAQQKNDLAMRQHQDKTKLAAKQHQDKTGLAKQGLKQDASLAKLAAKSKRRPVANTWSESLQGGHWVTVHGVHIYIKDGVVTEGPEDLKGKKASDIHSILSHPHDSSKEDGGASEGRKPKSPDYHYKKKVSHEANAKQAKKDGAKEAEAKHKEQAKFHKEQLSQRQKQLGLDKAKGVAAEYETSEALLKKSDKWYAKSAAAKEAGDKAGALSAQKMGDFYKQQSLNAGELEGKLAGKLKEAKYNFGHQAAADHEAQAADHEKKYKSALKGGETHKWNAEFHKQMAEHHKGLAAEASQVGNDLEDMEAMFAGPDPGPQNAVQGLIQQHNDAHAKYMEHQVEAEKAKKAGDPVLAAQHQEKAAFYEKSMDHEAKKLQEYNDQLKADDAEAAKYGASVMLDKLHGNPDLEAAAEKLKTALEDLKGAQKFGSAEDVTKQAHKLAMETDDAAKLWNTHQAEGHLQKAEELQTGPKSKADAKLKELEDKLAEKADLYDQAIEMGNKTAADKYLTSMAVLDAQVAMHKKKYGEATPPQEQQALKDFHTAAAGDYAVRAESELFGKKDRGVDLNFQGFSDPSHDASRLSGEDWNKTLGGSSPAGEKIRQAVKDWQTPKVYVEIRKADIGAATDPKYETMAEDLRTALKSAPQYKSDKPLFRGIKDALEVHVKSLQPGDHLSMTSFTSFSKSQDQAQYFLRNKAPKDGKVAVMFEVPKSTRGADISASKVVQEHEVIQDKGTRYKVSKVESRPLPGSTDPNAYYYHVHLEEAEGPQALAKHISDNNLFHGGSTADPSFKGFNHSSHDATRLNEADWAHHVSGKSQSKGAKEAKSLIHNWQGSGYSEMRKADMGLSSHPMWTERVQKLRDHLSRAPAYKSDQPLYRGVSGASLAEVQNIQPGDNLSLGALSSFSKLKDKALDFAGHSSGDKAAVVFQYNNPTKGADISSSSMMSHEKEVFQEKHTKFKVTKVEKQKTPLGGVYHVVHLSDAGEGGGAKGKTPTPPPPIASAPSSAESSDTSGYTVGKPIPVDELKMLQKKAEASAAHHAEKGDHKTAATWAGVAKMYKEQVESAKMKSMTASELHDEASHHNQMAGAAILSGNDELVKHHEGEQKKYEAAAWDKEAEENKAKAKAKEVESAAMKSKTAAELHYQAIHHGQMAKLSQASGYDELVKHHEGEQKKYAAAAAAADKEEEKSKKKAKK